MAAPTLKQDGAFIAVDCVPLLEIRETEQGARAVTLIDDTVSWPWDDISTLAHLSWCISAQPDRVGAAIETALSKAREAMHEIRRENSILTRDQWLREYDRLVLIAATWRRFIIPSVEQ